MEPTEPLPAPGEAGANAAAGREAVAAPSPPPESARLFQHYEVCLLSDGVRLHELGRGAMGITYKARDINLDTPVALKVVNALFSQSAEMRERFRREARSAAQLRHPNVASVFHFGETPAGQRFYAMEFIEGETLAQRVQRDGPLPAAMVVEIGLQVAAALMAADKQGLVHRDLKPGNLMLVALDDDPRRPGTTGPVLVKVIDFGLAKAAASAVEMESPLTQGGFLGTPAYASPEQVSGGPLDSRSDIFSLGATLWFLLTGRAPFAGQTLSEITDRQMNRPLPSGQLEETSVPAPLAMLVSSMLAADPAKRPASPMALHEALEICRAQITGTVVAPPFGSAMVAPARGRRFAVAGVLALVAVSIAAYFLSHRAAPAPAANATLPPLANLAAPEKSIAVLPFTNMTADAENAFFADGIQDEILSNLAKVADLKVISRTSVMQYRGAAKQSAREIGQQLGVAHLLEGTVQRSANRIRIEASLIDARTDQNQWSERYDRDLADVFAIQSEIATAIAAQLQAKLTGAEKVALTKPSTTNLAASDLYARANALLRTTSFNTRAKDDLLRASRLLDEAVTLDPNFLLAHCQLANVHGQLYLLGLDHTPARRALADAAAARALRIAPDSGDAHFAIAENLYRCHADFDGALAELAIARKSLPNDPRVAILQGFIERRQGADDAGLRHFARALELDPRNVYLVHQIALTYEMLHRYPDYAATLDRALILQPGDADTRSERASIDLKSRGETRPLHATVAEILAENPAAARSMADKWIDLALCERDADASRRAVEALGDNTFGQDAIRFSGEMGEALIARMSGDAVGAQAAFARAREQQAKVVEAQPDYSPALCVLALIDAGLGQKQDALRESQRAVELLPRKKDAINGPLVLAYAAIVAAWCGETDLAMQRLALATQLPTRLTFGQLKLHPFWDPIRSDPRFEKIVSPLAPKPGAKVAEAAAAR
jgi:TolB-like protein/Tfp pilus assembly protein PilF